MSIIVSFNLFFNTPTTFNLDLNRVKNLPIIAIDPEIVHLYPILEIENMGAFIVLDTGGLIKGNRIDILFNSKREAMEFGKQTIKSKSNTER